MRLRSLSMLTAAALAAVFLPAAGPADVPEEWEYVTAVPGLESGFAQRVWTGEPGVVYVLGSTAPQPYDTTVFRWDGSWSVELSVDGYYPDQLFGTGPDDIYLSMYTCWTGSSWSCPSSPYNNVIDATLLHFDGIAWSELAVPTPAEVRITSIAGVPGDVQIGAGPYALRDTGSGFAIVYDGGSGLTVAPKLMTALAADEAYMASCWGHGWWDGATWTKKVEFDFCDINDIWGARDDSDGLHLWIIGQNNFGNGVRIWSYDEATHSFGSKYGYEFGDPAGEYGRAGGGTGLWGAGWDDVYATGYRWAPYPTYRSGRIYHNDGTGWTQMTGMGEITTSVQDVWGTGEGDVWFLLSDGRLLHLGANEPPVADADGPYLAAVSQPFTVDGTASSDPDGDALTYTWSFEGTDLTGATPTFSAPAAAGVYPIQLTVSDGRDAAVASSTVVVYDPSAGFVTGGGWFDSPEGAYPSDATLTGKATFGFVSKYKKGATAPDGSTEFVFDAAGIDFHSSDYHWLVVTGNGDAKFKGSGTINDTGDFTFQVWAGDGDVDTFRIKIWDDTDVVVYDNGVDQVLGGGSIVIHTPKR